MDCQSTDIFEIYKLFSSLTENGITEMDNGFQVSYLNYSYLINPHIDLKSTTVNPCFY